MQFCTYNYTIVLTIGSQLTSYKILENTNEIDMTLGQKLRERRESLGLTRLQVARTCDVVESTVINWETDKHIPKLYPAQTKALCDLLKFTLDELALGQTQGD